MNKKLRILLQKYWIHFLAPVILIIIPALFFYPEIQGKKMSQDDVNESPGQKGELWHYRAETNFEREPLWTSGIYIGAPGIMNGSITEATLTPIANTIGLWLSNPFRSFYVLGISAFICLLILGVKPSLAIFGGLIFSLSTNNIILYHAGHMMKIGSIMYLPFMISGAYLLSAKQKYLSGTALFTLGLALSVYVFHIQMVYYFAISLIMFGLIYAFHCIRNKDYIHLAKVFCLVILGVITALGSNMAFLWPTYELSEETVRGPNILEPISSEQTNSNQTQPEASDGLDWDYAMAWSNNTLDVLSGLVPRIVGGSSAERVKSGDTFNALRRSGAAMQSDGSYKLPMYWGALPFTSGPVYFGAIIVFLFVFGAMVVKGQLKWWLVASTVFTVALSYGKNFELLSRFMFEYAPLYNKFRTPQSILSVTIVFITLLATLGAHTFFNASEKERKKMLKPFFVSLGIIGGISAFIAVLGPSLFSFSGANDATYRQSGLLTFLLEDRKSLMQQDALRSLAFILIAGAIMYAWHLKKIKLSVAITLLTIFVVGDLWGVNRRYIHPDDYEYNSGGQRVEEYYIERDVDRAIFAREDSRYDYRVLDLSINTFNTNYTSYFHNTIGGYSATKLQRIQDMQDIHLSRLTRPVLDMLNTTYIINQNEELIINDQALGWVWFVEDVQYVETNRDEINALTNIDPSKSAAVRDIEFSDYLSSFESPKTPNNDVIQRTNYELDIWEYSYDTDERRLAVFSEMWYKPYKGLKAYIDGQEAEFIRVNYMLRAMIVPEGSGVIEFRFEPRSYLLGLQIQRIFTLFLVLLLIATPLYYALTQLKKR